MFKEEWDTFWAGCVCSTFVWWGLYYWVNPNVISVASWFLRHCTALR